MFVVENGMNIIHCDCCSKDLIVSEDDLNEDKDLIYYLCPNCNSKIDSGLKKIKIENINFPDDFYEFNGNNGEIKPWGNDEIKKIIKDSIKIIRDNQEEFGFRTCSGRSFVYVHRWDEDEIYEVVYAPNYFSTEIDFQKEDFF